MKLPLIICTVLLLFSCQTEDNEKLKQEILDTDRSFSEMSSKEGIAKAFIFYADEKVIKPNHGQQPVVGKFALLEWFKNNPPKPHSLVWEPLKVEVSGQLGYTFGAYTLVTKTEGGRDTTYYGNYVSIWKQKKDGTWRYVLDTGNPTPGPVVLK